jgi:type IV secretory pathway VirB3-like protein
MIEKKISIVKFILFLIGLYFIITNPTIILVVGILVFMGILISYDQNHMMKRDNQTKKEIFRVHERSHQP